MIWDALCNIIKIITAQTEFLYISCILIVIYDVRTGPYLTDCNSLRDCRVSRDIPSKDLWNASFKPLVVQLCERYQSFSSYFILTIFSILYLKQKCVSEFCREPSNDSNQLSER